MRRVALYYILCALLCLVSCGEELKVDPNIIGSEGGSVFSADAIASITIPPNALDEGIKIDIRKINSDPPSNIGSVYNFTPHGIQFNKPVSITFTYNKEEVLDTEDFLSIAYQDGDIWKSVPTTINKANNTLTGIVDHFTNFAILSKPDISILLNTWSVELHYPTAAWIADVIFYDDFTLKYDEPAAPGLFLQYGTWAIEDGLVHWNIGVWLDMDDVKDSLHLDYDYIGNMNVLESTMTGISVSGLANFSAVIK